MAEGPRNTGGSSGGRGDDFDWMYGDKSGPRQPGGSNEPEPTRRLPVQPPPSTRPSGQQPPGTQPRTQPSAPAPYSPPPPRPPAGGSGGGAGRTGGRSVWSRPRTWVRIVLALVLLWVVYLVAVPAITWSKVDKIAFEPDGKRPDDQPGTTYLMVGNDSRSNLTEEQRKEYHTGNPSSSLADTILMLHTGDGPDVLLSFPRDLMIDGHKINGLWDPDDPTGLVKALEDLTGIRIDEYVEIGLGGVAGVVDAVGGIQICPKEDLKDKLAGLDVKKGCQEADGQVALAYARSRHSSALSDLDRVQRQREVVAAIGKKVLSPWSVVNPIRYWRLNQAVPDFFAFGEGTGPVAIAKWALAMSKVGKDGKSCTLPVTDASAGSVDHDRADPLFKSIIDDHTDDITKKQCSKAGVPGT
ncbi:LCP family protein [Nocardioides sp. MH1]|uniref:LCP family protein n=1 Tax=Nocardioides sp. MH1 TaxID=3242490 RepID=UPI00352115C2